MSTAKLNDRYDYMTLRIKFDDGATFNLTRSRNGTTISGTKASRPVLEFFDAWLQKQKGQTYGQTMESLRVLATTCKDIGEFIQALPVSESVS